MPRPTALTTALTTALPMTAGAHRLLHVAAGTCWRVTAGSVRLTEPPRWLAERVVAIDMLLSAGQGHVVQRSGWVMMRALTDAVLLSDAPALSPWRQWVAALLRWRQVRPRRTPRAGMT